MKNYTIIILALIIILYIVWIENKKDKLMNEGKKIIKACNVGNSYKVVGSCCIFLIIRVKKKSKWYNEYKTMGKLIKEIISKKNKK